MKIFMVNVVYGHGSTGRICQQLRDLIVDEGHEFKIAYGRGAQLDSDETIKISGKTDMYIHGLLSRACDSQGLHSTRETKKLIKELENFRPDIIHLHNIHGYYLNYQILFKYLALSNIKIIWTLHDCWAFTGHCAHFDYIDCQLWKKEGCHDCPQIDTYPKAFIDRSEKNFRLKKEAFTSVKNMTLVTPSDWLKSKVKESFLKKYDTRVVKNGINVSDFTYIQSEFKEEHKIKDKIMILGVANIWGARKGLSVFKKLSVDLPDNYQIVMIGLNETQIKELPANIIKYKRTDSIKELVEIYSAADIFINPTLEEVLGLVNLEALACGTPVITYQSGGSVECVNEDVGIVIEKGNYEKLKKAVIDFEFKKYKKTDCVAFANTFALEKRFHAYIDLYKEVYHDESFVGNK